MSYRFKEPFTSHGLFLNKKISLHFSLQKGRENGKNLGNFNLDLEGCSNIARKLALVILMLILGSDFFKKILKKYFQKHLTIM